MQAHPSAAFGYGVAVAGVLLTVLIRMLLPLPLDQVPLLPFLLPVMIAAFVGGLAPGVLATLIACAVGLTLFGSTDGEGFGWDGNSLLAVGLFAAEGGLASWLIGARPHAIRALGLAQRSEVEAALRMSEERYRAIVDTQAEMVCRFRPDGQIIFVNGGYARARGTVPEALVGRNFWQFIAEEDRPAVRAMLDRLTPEASVIRIENRFETADGVRWTLWTNRALTFDEAGRWTEAQSTGIDITDRKEAEQALREANRRKSEFLAILGHELRNPLAPLSAGLKLLRQPGRDAEPTEKILTMMKRQLDHLTRLVEDLLDLSRISRGEIALGRTPLDLRGVIEAAVELCLPPIEARGHRLVVATGAEPLPVEGDAQRLTQVVGNVLSNAAKYTEPGGRIEVRALAEDGHAVIRVRDTGFGIPAERLETLFDMFSQVPEHRESTGGGGLGIGLALSRQLIVQHGGSIEATSDGLGHGSEFIVRLPLTVAELGTEPRAANTTRSGVPRRILIVDDNDDAAESLRLVLEFEGHVVHVEHDARGALQAMDRFAPQVVLLDIGLPEMDGYEAARRIRAMPQGRAALLVAVTGWGQSEDRQRALEAGFDEHMAKPVDFARLTALMESEARPAPSVAT